MISMTKLRIDGINFNIELVKEPLILDNEVCKAIIHLDTGTVQIDSKLHHEAQLYALWHEIGHTLSDCVSDCKDEEAFSDRFASFMHSLLGNEQNQSLLQEYGKLPLERVKNE